MDQTFTWFNRTTSFMNKLSTQLNEPLQLIASHVLNKEKDGQTPKNNALYDKDKSL